MVGYRGCIGDGVGLADGRLGSCERVRFPQGRYEAAWLADTGAKLLRVSVSAQFVCVFQAGSDSRWRRPSRSAMTQKHSNVLADMSGKLVPARGLRVAIGPLLRSVCDAGRLSLGRSTWPVECCRLGPVEISSWCDVASGVAMS